MPLIEVARTKTKPEALQAFERWRARHADVAELLEPADILIDGMRGSSSVWYRVRLNLQHVPADRRPEQEPLEADYDPWAAMRARMATHEAPAAGEAADGALPADEPLSDGGRAQG